MSDLYRDDGAEVVVLRVPAQANETKAREIGALFPGWHVWYSDWSDTWDAYREGEEPYFGPGAVAGRAFMVSSFPDSVFAVNSRCGLPFQIFVADLLRRSVLKPGVPTL